MVYRYTYKAVAIIVASYKAFSTALRRSMGTPTYRAESLGLSFGSACKSISLNAAILRHTLQLQNVERESYNLIGLLVHRVSLKIAVFKNKRLMCLEPRPYVVFYTVVLIPRCSFIYT